MTMPAKPAKPTERINWLSHACHKWPQTMLVVFDFVFFISYGLHWEAWGRATKRNP